MQSSGLWLEMVAVIGVLFAELFIVGVCLFSISHDNKVRKLIVACYDDLIPLKAESRFVDTRYIYGRAFVKIEISFKLNGKKYKKVSGKSSKNSFGEDYSYQKIYKRYVGREIDILYSKKYDEVFVLK